MLLSAAVVVLSGCSNEAPTSPRSFAPGSISLHDLADSATYISEGGELSGGFSGSVSGAFFSSNTTFQATAPIWWQWVSDVSATVKATVVGDGGATINTASSGGGRSGVIPNFSRVDTTLHASAGTLGHTCGITGKSNLTATASLRLLANSTITTFWRTDLNTDGEDVPLSACDPITTTQSQPSPCPGQLIYDPSTCNDSGGGGTGGGGGYDPDNGCTYYLITPVISYDGGNSWYQNGDSYIVSDC